MKKMLFLTLFTFLTLSVTKVTFAQPRNISSTPYSAYTESNSIVPRADRVEWRYKYMNGKLYKRLYNLTKKEWIGKWEPF